MLLPVLRTVLLPLSDDDPDRELPTDVFPADDDCEDEDPEILLGEPPDIEDGGGEPAAPLDAPGKRLLAEVVGNGAFDEPPLLFPVVPCGWLANNGLTHQGE